MSHQNWRHLQNQSATALVSPRILSRPSRPISTLQEVTSEAEDEERAAAHPAARATAPHFLYPQPAPRQRSFSCTQPAPQRRHSATQPQEAEKQVDDRVEVVVVPDQRTSTGQSENRESESKRSCEEKGQDEGPDASRTSIQTVM